MWRIVLIAWLLVWAPARTEAHTQAQHPTWEACHGEAGVDGPVLHDCRPVEVVDPQGRELWLRATVARPSEDGPQAFYVVGVASSEVWLNGNRLGANGQPGSSASAEVPGRFQIALPIPERGCTRRMRPG